MVHCSPESPAPKSLPMVGSATLTTVASSITSPDPSTQASRTHRPAVDRRRTAPAVPETAITPSPSPFLPADLLASMLPPTVARHANRPTPRRCALVEYGSGGLEEVRVSRSEEHTSELQSRGHLVC